MTLNHRAPFVLLAVLLTATASACGPLTIDLTPLATAKPSAQPSGSSTAVPSPLSSVVPHPSTSPTATSKPGETPDPNATPTGTPDPNATPTPMPDPNATATPTPGPQVSLTPRPWPTGIEIPGGTPVVGEEFAIQSAVGSPVDVAVEANGTAWIAIGTRNGTSADTHGEIVRMSADGTPLSVLKLDGNPRRIEAAAGGGIWVALDAKNTQTGQTGLTVLRLGADAKQMSRISLGSGGSSSGDMVRLVPDVGGNLWVRGASYDGARLYRVAPGGGLLGSYVIPGAASSAQGGLGVDQSGSAWISLAAEHKVFRIAPNMTKAGEWDAATTGSSPMGAYCLQATGDTLWLALGQQLQVRDLTGQKKFDIQTGFYVEQMRPAPDGGMWCLGGTNPQSASVVLFDAKGDAQASYAVNESMYNFGLGGDGSLWSANYTAKTATRVGTR